MCSQKVNRDWLLKGATNLCIYTSLLHHAGQCSYNLMQQVHQCVLASTSVHLLREIEEASVSTCQQATYWPAIVHLYMY